MKDSNKYIKLMNSKYYIKSLLNRKKRPLVSIIIPFYNGIETIDNTLKSIKKSGYPNYEVLVINDGCDQDAESICNKYKNVKYFYKKNEGPGLTRNFGLEKAKGKYVFFLDADDEICKYALNHLVDYAEKEKLNLVCGICRRVYYNTKSTSYWYRDLYKKHAINYKEMRHLIINDTTSTSKLYNLKALKESGIKFESGLYEDNLFIARVYNEFEEIGLIPYVVYTWYVYGKDTSITTTNTIDNYMQRLEKVEKIINFASVVDKVYYLRHLTTHHLYIFINSFNNYSEKERKIIFNRVREIYINNLDYVYDKIVYLPSKKIILHLILDNDYKKFSEIASMISEEFLNNLEKM